MDDRLRYFTETYGRLPLDMDFVYLYSDLRSFGVGLITKAESDSLCAAIVEPLLERGKTVLMPAFTYTSSGRFDVLATPTRLGALNKWMLRCADAERSEHPLFSYVGRGPSAAGLLRNIGKSAFGTESVFERLHGRGCAFLHVGRPVWMGNTALHHVEQLGGATYRFNKAFRTEVYRGEAYVGTDYTAFVRRLDVPGETFAFDFRRGAALLFEAGLVREEGDGGRLTNVSAYPYDAALSVLRRGFDADPTLFINSSFIQY